MRKIIPIPKGRNFPYHLFILTFFAVLECSLYLLSYNEIIYSPVNWKLYKSQDGIVSRMVNNAEKGSEAYQLGFRNGDKILRIDGKPFKSIVGYLVTLYSYRPNQTAYFEIKRDYDIFLKPVRFRSYLLEEGAFFLSYYFLIAVVLSIGILVLLKRPDDKAARIFFVFTQVFGVCLNSQTFLSDSLYSLFRNAVFMFTHPFLGAVLIHFFLRFPGDNKIIKRFPAILRVIYIISLIISSAGFLIHIMFLKEITERDAFLLNKIGEVALLWMSSCLLAATFIGLYNLFTTKGTVIRNQYRWIMFGIVLGLLPETGFGFFNSNYQNFSLLYPHMLEYVWAIGSILLVIFLSMAILKYKLWDIEIIVKRTLQYSIITALIAACYLILVALSEYFFNSHSAGTKFLSVGFSAFLFIPVRELVQKKVDRVFHRESYDATNAALNFESRVLNSSREKNLYRTIGDEIDSIFHFIDFRILLKESSDRFITVYSTENSLTEKHELNETCNLSLDEVPSDNLCVPAFEVRNMPGQLQTTEFLFTINKGSEIIGLFACGGKKSERMYSRQDVELLKLLANRSATIIQMYNLYRLEIERREMLEKERLRISKDMHDEIGSSLTQIAVISEILSKAPDKPEAEESIKKISGISREVIDNISEIVWAINPKNDSLDNLAAYLREYAGGLFDSAEINCRMDFSEDIPPFTLQADIRRNIFLSAKEIFNNIIKHSKAKNVFLQFEVCDSRLIFTIEDDGLGFNEKGLNNKTGHGNGLINIRKRLQDSGGVAEIHSEEGKGTRIRLSLKLEAQAEEFFA